MLRTTHTCVRKNCADYSNEIFNNSKPLTKYTRNKRERTPNLTWFGDVPKSTEQRQQRTSTVSNGYTKTKQFQVEHT